MTPLVFIAVSALVTIAIFSLLLIRDTKRQTIK